MADRLTDKIALITGSTSGIGRATAELFAREGARVMINGRREDLGQEVAAGIRKAGGVADYYRADVSVASELQALVDWLLEQKAEG